MQGSVFLYRFMKADLTCIGLQLDFFHCPLICKLISCITDDTRQKQKTKTTFFLLENNPKKNGHSFYFTRLSHRLSPRSHVCTLRIWKVT